LDDAARRSIERSLMAARSRDSNDGRLDEIEQRWRSVKARQPVPRSA
jgi:hypothetical protein